MVYLTLIGYYRSSAQLPDANIHSWSNTGNILEENPQATQEGFQLLSHPWSMDSLEAQECWWVCLMNLLPTYSLHHKPFKDELHLCQVGEGPC